MIESKNFTFDKIIPFTLKKSKIRGRFVKLDKSISKILNRHNYELPISISLAEILSVSCCIGSLLKFNGNFTIQGSSKEILKTVVADYSSNGSIRAYASYDNTDVKSNNLTSFDELMPKGHFAFTAIENKSNKRYQGIIPVQKGNFENSVHYYFHNSEQVNSEIVCFSNHHERKFISAAILIQKMPSETFGESDDFNLFEEAKLFLKSLTKTELLSSSLGMEEILYKLFHSFGVRVQKEIVVKDKCRCSIARVKNTIKQISTNELSQITLPDGSLDIICEFCKKKTKLIKKDLDSIRN